VAFHISGNPQSTMWPSLYQETLRLPCGLPYIRKPSVYHVAFHISGNPQSTMWPSLLSHSTYIK